MADDSAVGGEPDQRSRWTKGARRRARRWLGESFQELSRLTSRLRGTLTWLRDVRDRLQQVNGYLADVREEVQEQRKIYEKQLGPVLFWGGYLRVPATSALGVARQMLSTAVLPSAQFGLHRAARDLVEEVKNTGPEIEQLQRRADMLTLELRYVKEKAWRLEFQMDYCRERRSKDFYRARLAHAERIISSLKGSLRKVEEVTRALEGIAKRSREARGGAPSGSAGRG